MAQSSFPLPPKKGSWCGTEVQTAVKILLQYRSNFRHYEDIIYEKIQVALQGKRTIAQIKDWYSNTKKILENEGRWTKIINIYLTEEEKNNLRDLIMDDGNGQPNNDMSIKSEEQKEGREEAMKESILKLFSALSSAGKQEIRLAMMK